MWKRDLNGSEQRMDAMFAKLDTQTGKALLSFESKMDGAFAAVRGELTLLKWMLGIQVTGIVSLVVRTFF